MRDRHPVKTILAALAIVAASVLAPGLAPAQENPVKTTWDPVHSKEAIKLDDLKQKLGIELVSLRRSAAGHILDLRYRIVDREKATPFVQGRVKPYLADPDRKLLMFVPFAEKVGKLQQVHLSSRPGFVYFMLFGNTGRLVQAGDHVTVVFGDYRIDDVVVEG